MHFAQLAQRTTTHKIVASLLALAVLTASSHIAVPIGPVPITMQTLAVTLTGVLLGARWGASIVALWVALGVTGIPVLAFGHSGLVALLGPTAGYLYAFPLAAAVTSLLAGKGGLVRTFGAMLVGNALCLVVGAAWLSLTLPVAQAIAVGVTPFIVGGLLKSALGALLIKAMEKH